jgi:F-box and leucine-rich repeat protein 14
MIVKLQVLDLLSCNSFSTAGVMQAAEHLTGLRRLAVHSCSYVQIDALLPFATLTDLVDLSLGDAPAMIYIPSELPTYLPLPWLPPGASLTRLVLTPVAGIMDEDLTRLAVLTRLRSLTVSSLVRNRSRLAIGSRRRALGVRDLIGVSDAGVAALKSLTNLTALGLHKCEGITNIGVLALRCLSGLERLDCSRSRLTEAGLSALSSLSRLREVALGMGTQLPDLQMLTLYWAAAPCSAFAPGLVGTTLCELRLLTRVSLTNCVTDADLVHLAALSRLCQLSLERCDVTDAGLAALLPLPALHHVDLKNCRDVSEACRSGWDTAAPISIW